MRLQQLLSYVRRAVDDYKMIKEGDVIAIGISGGKDSLTLLYALAQMRRFYAVRISSRVKRRASSRESSSAGISIHG